MKTEAPGQFPPVASLVFSPSAVGLAEGMDEIGVVKGLHGKVATVSVTRQSACEQCKMGCNLTESGAEIEAINEAGAEIGQKVRILMSPYSYLKGSLLVYGVPSAALIFGAVIGKEFLSPLLKAADPDILSAIAGFGAFIISFSVVKAWSRRVERKAEYRPVVKEIIEG
ncbi:MAG: SoxR reducing system RseC family protein [Thermodesulfovibrionales bacterium]|jgi:sigma-E factor negative regulatory protein RseC